MCRNPTVTEMSFKFGLRWSGKGFTYSSSPGWHFPDKPVLDDFEIVYFAGAQVIDLANAQKGFVTAGITGKLG